MYVYSKLAYDKDLVLVLVLVSSGYHVRARSQIHPPAPQKKGRRGKGRASEKLSQSQRILSDLQCKEMRALLKFLVFRS